MVPSRLFKKKNKVEHAPKIWLNFVKSYLTGSTLNGVPDIWEFPNVELVFEKGRRLIFNNCNFCSLCRDNKERIQIKASNPETRLALLDLKWSKLDSIAIKGDIISIVFKTKDRVFYLSFIEPETVIFDAQ